MPTGMRTIDVTALIERRRFDGSYYGLIALSWLITAFDGLDGLMIGFTLPYMRDELHLTTTMMGYIAAAGNAGTAAGSFLSPLLADRIGRRPTTIAMALMFGVLTTATALAGSYEALVVMRLVSREYFIVLALKPDGNLGRGRYELRKAELDLAREFVL